MTVEQLRHLIETDRALNEERRKLAYNLGLENLIEFCAGMQVHPITAICQIERLLLRSKEGKQ